MTTSRIVKALIAIACVLAVCAGALAVAIRFRVPLSAEAARTRLIATLAERFDAEVALDELQVQTLPVFRAQGRGLTIRHKGRHDVPPLISIQSFAVESPLLSLLHGHLSRVDVRGLDIEIPPDRNRTGDAGAGSVSDANRHDLAKTLIVDDLFSTGARLTIIPGEAAKAPKVWDIHDLHMRMVSTGSSMPFEATLTNAVPPGEIRTQGTFGPWQSGDPGQTPLAGLFTFARADLSVFKGISGILSAHGQFGGRLERIDVHGETDTPEFKVKTGLPVPLRTRYHAIVDGTNGNTELEEVDASFLNTSLVAKGGVIEKGDKTGRTVTLHITMDRGRLEDVLRLSVNTSKPPMTGALRLTTAFVLPPGDIDVVQKLRLNGEFSIAGSQFTNLDVQQKINELSRRSRGRVEQAASHVVSRFDGRFRLSDGTLRIPRVAFDVPGSLVQLEGTYDLVPETLDFKGTLYMDVKLSETTTGLKSLLLKMADPFFKRPGGGSAIPIRITGSRSDPSFGLDRSQVFPLKHQS